MIIVANHDYVTDELTIVFYECPNCFFEYVPHAHPDREFDGYGEKSAHTAKFCPNCGQPIEWV